MNNKSTGIIFAAALSCLAASASVIATEQGAAADQDMPGLAAGGTLVVTATVEAINMQTREVALRHPDGTLEVLVVGEEARNLGQVKVGDKVTATYQVGLVMELAPAAGGVRERVETVEAGRSELGQKPAAVVRKTVQAKGTVQAIDMKARTVTLQGALRTMTLPVADDVDLKNIKVGDSVYALYVESAAISVQPAGE